MPAEFCILEAVRFLLGRENILAKCALIAFEGEDVIGSSRPSQNAAN
jgi:hypothetical protein